MSTILGKQKRKVKRISLKRQLKKFRPNIRSRHPSHNILRSKLPLLPFRSIVRLGSTTEINDGRERIECNSVQAVKNSASKLLMKKCFTKAEVKTALWYIYEHGRGFVSQNDNIAHTIEHLPYPIVAKSHYGSRGEGNTKIDSPEQFKEWQIGKNLLGYIFEKYYNFSREYRIHVTKEGYFYTCRKMIKEETPENERWYRNDSNSVWILEQNELFDKPSNWDSIVEHSVKALNAVGLDIGAIDVKVQSAKDSKGRVRENPEFIILETNSAPSFGEITGIQYIQHIEAILRNKYYEINKPEYLGGLISDI